MLGRRSILAVAVSTLSVNAISGTCGTGLASLAIGDLGACLQLTSLIPVLGGSGSITSNLNTYLTSLCASSTPTCSNTTLTSAQSSIASACSSDLQGGGTNAAEVQALTALLGSYPEVYAAACSKNSTTSDFCVVQTLDAVSTYSGQNVTSGSLFSILSGSGDNTSLANALSSGQLCTGCVQEIYYQALQANSSIADTSVGQSISGTCGDSFGTAPSGVSTASTSSNTSAATASSTSGAAGGAGTAMRMPSLLPVCVAGGAVVVAAVIGGLSVL